MLGRGAGATASPSSPTSAPVPTQKDTISPTTRSVQTAAAPSVHRKGSERTPRIPASVRRNTAAAIAMKSGGALASSTTPSTRPARIAFAMQKFRIA